MLAAHTVGASMSGALPRSHPAAVAAVAAAMAVCLGGHGRYLFAAPAFVPSLRTPGAQPDQASNGGLAPAIHTITAGAQAPDAATCLASCATLLAVGTAAARRRRGQRTPRCVEAAAEEGEGGEWMGAAAFSKLTESVPLKLDNVAVSKILPHRYPFLLVDKVVEYEPGKRAVGVKNVTANEPQFTGHFPDRPIMPGVLMVEAMAQLGGIVCLQPPVSDGKGEFFFAGINGVKFRRPVVPGDTLVMEMELMKFREKYGIAKMTGKAYVDGQLALEVKDFTFALVKES